MRKTERMRVRKRGERDLGKEKPDKFLYRNDLIVFKIKLFVRLNLNSLFIKKLKRNVILFC